MNPNEAPPSQIETVEPSSQTEAPPLSKDDETPSKDKAPPLSQDDETPSKDDDEAPPLSKDGETPSTDKPPIAHQMSYTDHIMSRREEKGVAYAALSKPLFSAVLNAVVLRYAAASAVTKPVNAALISSAVAVKHEP
uniref:Uncharacterized protein n=1 Tax=Chenopodium quinoa TaxID=63459 RepID=A0A803MQ63_CHEQI